MGEEAGRLNRGTVNSTAWDSTTTNIQDTPVEAGTADDPRRINQEIEHTRAEMSETIDAIQDRLNPEHLKEQAKGAVRDATIGRAQDMLHNAGDTAKQTGGGIVETIRQNPIPAALAGVGIGWLWKNRTASRSHSSQPYSYRPGGYRSTYAAGGYGDVRGYQGAQDYQGYSSGYSDWSRQQADWDRHHERGAMSTVQDSAGQAKDRMQHAGSEAVEQVQELGMQARDRMSDLGGQAQMQFQNVRARYDDMLQQSPLAIGAVALGLGFVAGLLIPETQKEHQLMGEQRDQLLDKGKDIAQQTMDKVQHVAQDATQAAKESAREQGVTAS